MQLCHCGCRKQKHEQKNSARKRVGLPELAVTGEYVAASLYVKAWAEREREKSFATAAGRWGISEDKLRAAAGDLKPASEQETEPPKQMSTTDKAALAKELLADPSVRRTIADDFNVRKMPGPRMPRTAVELEASESPAGSVDAG